jgi:gliding motility-associated-like protein
MTSKNFTAKTIPSIVSRMALSFRICFLSLFFITSIMKAQTYSPIVVSGFNKDVIAEATTALATTNASMDLSNYIMYSQSFASATGITGGLPNNGTIVSGTRTYKLAAYNGNNTLNLLQGNTLPLNFTTPSNYSKLSICAFASEGNCTATAIVGFTDGTTYNPGNINIGDWFNGTGSVLCCFGRTTRNNGPYTAGGVPSNPNFYKYDINLPCAYAKKQISKITFNIVSGSTSSSRLFVMAISGVSYQLSSTDVPVNISCTGPITGSDTIKVLGTNPPYSYSWNTPVVQLTNPATNLAAGTYVCTITDALNCSITDTVTITQDTIATVTITASNDTVCLGDTIYLNTSSLSHAVWSHNADTNLSTFIIIQADTSLFVYGTNANGCSGSDTIQLFVFPHPTVQATTSDDSLCVGESCQLNATGGLYYTWESNASLSNLNIPNPVASPTLNAGYFVTGYNGDGCSDKDTVYVNVSAQPNLSVNSTSICLGTNAALTAVGAANFNWSPSAGLSNTSGGQVTASPNITSTYTVIGNINYCYDTAYSTVTILPLPATPTIGFNTANTVCDDDTIILFTNISASYHWSNGLTNNPIIITSTSNVWVYVTDVNGCISDTSTTVTATVLPPVQSPVLVTSDPFILCANDSATISLQSTVYNPIIAWNPASLGILDTNSITIHNNQSISAFVTDTFGCVSANSNILNFQFTPLPPAPSIIASGSTSFCTGDSVRLDITGINNILWSNGETDNSITVHTTNLYTVAGIDSCGIPHNSNINVNVYPLPVPNFTADILKGCIPLQTHFINTSVGGSNYIWEFGDGNNSTLFEPDYVYLNPGKFDCKLQVISAAGCKNTMTIADMIEAAPRPIARFDFTPDSLLINESTPYILFNNQSDFADSILWEIAEYNISSSADSIIATMQDTGNHQVQLIAMSSFGCSDTIVREIYVNGDFVMYMPNAFSPCKQDGLNDVWRPVYSHLDKKSFKLLIFDRWGILIKDITDPDAGWDGKIDDKYILGSYNYIINCLDDRGVTHSTAGMVTVIP